MRTRAGLIHCLGSLMVAAAVLGLVYIFWYPPPFFALSDGARLVGLILIVDVLVGPLLTLVVYSPKKTVHHRRTDLAIVILLQVGALGYGLWTVAQARPTHLVFEYSKFTILHRVDIEDEAARTKLVSLETKFPGVALPVIGLRPFASANEQLEYTMAAMSGVPLSTRVELWSRYDPKMSEIADSAKPISESDLSHDKIINFDSRLNGGLSNFNDRFLSIPLTERSRTARVILNRNGLSPVKIIQAAEWND